MIFAELAASYFNAVENRKLKQKARCPAACQLLSNVYPSPPLSLLLSSVQHFNISIVLAKVKVIHSKVAKLACQLAPTDNW